MNAQNTLYSDPAVGPKESYDKESKGLNGSDYSDL